MACRTRLADVSIRQHTSVYVRIRQHTAAYVSIRQHTETCGWLLRVAFLPNTSSNGHICETSCVRERARAREGEKESERKEKGSE